MDHPGGQGSADASRPKVFFWPDYSRTNPYLGLLYADAKATFDIGPGTLADAMAALQGPQLPQPSVIFHLHWLNQFILKAKTEDAARSAFEAFLVQLDAFRTRGGRFVWTIHNAVSHDSPFPALEREMSALIARRADVVHLHSLASVPEVLAAFPLPTDRIVISAHGNFVSVYQDDGLTQDAARRTLGINPDDDLVLSFGLVRPYKGYEVMFSAFRALLPARPHLRLLIAGRDFGRALPGILGQLTPEESVRVLVVDQFIEPERIQYFLRAADVGLLPYRSILTSGSLLLALTFGLPVVIPDVGMTREVLAGHDAGISYPPGSEAGTVAAALKTVLSRKDRGTNRQMSANAWARARELAWPDFTPVLEKALGPVNRHAPPVGRETAVG
jgi:glycosyltransferase involved in cell wall biosynthesis